MTEQNVTAIVVAYNSAGVIGKALAVLNRQIEVKQIIVVDNCSEDDTCKLITRDFPNVMVIKNQANEGFGRANNTAFTLVQTPFALLVNPDAVLEEGALACMLAVAAGYPDAAIIAPQLVNPDGNLYNNFKRNVFIREKHRPDFIMPEGDCCAEYLSGAVWLVNMGITKQVGFFDPNIFLFYEDDDLCLRMRQAGYSLIVAYNARAMHIQGGSSGASNLKKDFFIQKHLTWSRLYLEYKYHGSKAAKKLMVKTNIINWCKLLLNGIVFRRKKMTRLQGRLKGAAQFSESLKSGDMHRQP